jgi:hypothetical protein
MSKSKLIIARDLIKAKRYDEARSMLLELDDPTAQKWLDELDRIAPPTLIQSLPEDKGAGRNFMVVIASIAIMLLITFVIAIYGAFFRPTGIANAQSGQQWAYVAACYFEGSYGFAFSQDVNETLFSDLEYQEFTGALYLNYGGFGRIDLAEFLNRFGNAGWELVSIANYSEQYNDCDTMLMFKQPK